MSNKEKVLAYFEEWAGKGINLQNGCAIQKCPNHYLTGYFGIYINGKRVASLSKKEQYEPFKAVARILQLDPPMAAPIVWEDGANGFINSDCLSYSIQKTRDAKFRVTFPDHYKKDFDTEGEAKRACQDDKQKHYNQLGGYNEQ